MFVLLQLDAGGSERVVLDLARSLDPQRYEIYIAAFKGGVLETPLKAVCRKIFFVDKGPGFDISAMLQLAQIVRKNRIDVVNAHHYMPCFYSFLGTCLLSRKKLVYTEHSIPEVEGVASGIHGKILFWMFFRINAVIGVSKEISESFKRIYPRHADKVLAVLNGVDIEMFHTGEKGKETREKWGLSPDHFVVGTVANFRRVKNHACLVRAAARLKASYPQLRLLFAGTGFPGDMENSENEVRKLIHDLDLEDMIILAGYQENIPELLSVFDAFCLPSFSEGLPVSVLEAMAAGIPVIGSQVRGIKEVVADRETGLLFLSDDDADLARALGELLESKDLATSVAGRAFEYVAKTHSNSAWAAKMSGIFQADK